MKFQTSFLSFSYQGQRDYQQDKCYPEKEMSHNSSQCIFAVCDGMGGTEQGEVASRLVIEMIARVHDALTENYLLTPEDLSSFLSHAYDSLDADGKNIDTGTTLAMLWLHRGGCAMVNLGDSRVYQFREGTGIVYRSKDHSLVNDLVEAHVITPEAALTHPQRNVITRCMEPASQNRQRDKATAFFTEDIQLGDIFLVCSDGVTGEVSDESLTSILLADGTLENKLATIAAFCEDADDNATAILVEIENVEREGGEDEALSRKIEIDPEVRDLDVENSTSEEENMNFFQRLLNKFF